MRNFTRTICFLALAFSAGGAIAAGCGGSKSTLTGGGANGGSSSGTMSAGTGATGTMSAGTGAGGSTGTGFGDGGPGCLQVGAGCTAAGECCSGTCNNSVCNLPACTADTKSCTANAQCCSGNCTMGACVPLPSGGCKTLNNPCTTGADCCSGNCMGGMCQASSFCNQNGDVCATDTQCCGGICTKMAGALYGTCSQPSGGSSNCGFPDGVLCAGGATLGDGGISACGGGCCSRLCAPWGPTQILVCQPASGCHPVGDLCTKDLDCCGAAGLPGGSGMPVTCTITPPATVGTCRLPMGCKPDGDVCRLATMSCNETCDCCSGNCHQDTCIPDSLGVPRCGPGTCVMPGGACASSASCCNNVPCIPNPVDGGTPPYICANGCQQACGKCTTNADCCPGTSCILAPGSADGVCGPCGGSSTSSSGTTTTSSGSTTTSSTSSTGGPTCGLYGQECTSTSLCCNGIPCETPGGAPCTAADTGCTCHVAVQ